MINFVRKCCSLTKYDVIRNLQLGVNTVKSECGKPVSTQISLVINNMCTNCG